MQNEVKLAGFILLLVVIFAAGHAVGARLGPVATTSTQGGSGGGGGEMNMGR
jgi:hypothetical protein